MNKISLRKWLNDLVIKWMFGGERCSLKDRVTEVSGYDDDRCIFTGDHIVTWPKKQKKSA